MTMPLRCVTAVRDSGVVGTEPLKRQACADTIVGLLSNTDTLSESTFATAGSGLPLRSDRQLRIPGSYWCQNHAGRSSGVGTGRWRSPRPRRSSEPGSRPGISLHPIQIAYRD
jgi:hypothetical protein